jgi:hypothetical protein
MKIRNLFLPSIALGAAVLLSTPEESQAFNLLSHSLSPNQNDFRILNTFQDTGANNNTTPDDQFPGYTGAVMALWKGCIEWSSGIHGDGTGDPHQAVLGSGGSSFDAMFNGEAGGVGSIGNNIISPLDQNGGGVLAFMQGGSSGWWIRFYESVSWSDGPGTFIGGGNFDLQAVGCHEYGHAIGMSHELSLSSATMWPSIGNGSISERSISNDDKAGMQAKYGVANNSGTKPTITQAINLGGQVHIFGTNYKTSNNEVWFTRLTVGSTGGGGNPIKVTGVSSMNGGTEIIMTIPATAGPGEIMVLRNATTQEATSASFPFDPLSVPPPVPSFASISPPQVPVLTTSGPATVVVTGSGFSGASGLFVNDKVVDNGNSFSGTWSVDSDTQITFTMPLTGSLGMVPVGFDTPGGPILTSIEIVSAPTPAMAVEDPLLDQAVGLSIATSSLDLDIVILQFSVVDGQTTIPGLIDLEIGGGVLSNIYEAKTWTMGPKESRKLDSGPLSNLPIGVVIFFEGLVLPVAQNYDFPWGSTNKTMITVNS